MVKQLRILTRNVLRANVMRNKNSNPLIIFHFALLLLYSASLLAQTSARKSIDPKGEFAKLVGQVTQVEGMGTTVGNGFVVGPDGCFLITNVHVAYGKSVDEKTRRVILVDNVEVGHVVNFAFDLNVETGRFTKRVKATVIDFGNYNETRTGQINDIAVLRLDTCFGEKYSMLEFDRPPEHKLFPTGRLMTVAATTNLIGKDQIVSQIGCRAMQATNTAGMIFTDCDNPHGASGSMMLEEGLDGKWRLVGINSREIVQKNGMKTAQSIYALQFNKFLDPIFLREKQIASPLEHLKRKITDLN